ncbi:hypothetical protein APASM_4731 [Actinosynnema pretiosum subsp. pretiosum]|nr:hypothetical protein APASM_4731 [Actinosynnema pretiosum subsp. pretiosum]
MVIMGILTTLTAARAAATALAAPVPPCGPDLPEFTAQVSEVTAERLGASWRAGCPVGPEALRLVSLGFIGFDGAAHRGELVVAEAVAGDVVEVFRELYEARFPVERVETVEKHGADDDASMAANNTSAFNCRPITGGTAWSNHSYGRAIDLNPVQNPYVSASGAVHPPSGAPYVDRTVRAPGLIVAGDVVVTAFESRGWTWGGRWQTPLDYQHFELP